ncbi:hypothetical protein DES53_11721 [Roseimicrobium gellanilyticum]|uniref:Uncharacterized protein n=1 Tax=Roseimicrobium gellanilyticum TaxID=748857 RepID=A0A366H3B2_9BACT|nr:hypothetical protein DES53_11721 [Roseimicrobium gellanilyticum]
MSLDFFSHAAGTRRNSFIVVIVGMFFLITFGLLDLFWVGMVLMLVTAFVGRHLVLRPKQN